MTNQAGQESSGTRAHFRPFGKFALEPSDKDKSGHHLFTSKELDSTGLYDFDARLYDPATGRFTQADDIQVGSSSQAQNRYSYVFNNPLVMTDPTGREAENMEVTSDTRWESGPEPGTVTCIDTAI